MIVEDLDSSNADIVVSIPRDDARCNVVRSFPPFNDDDLCNDDDDDASI